VGAKGRPWAIAICAIWLTGCTPLANVVKTSLLQPLEYCGELEDCVELRRNRAVAQEAWAEFQCNSTDTVYSPDFECGFKAGFAVYLFNGQANPPPTPPRTYWRSEYETIEGRLAILDWFNGYRRGVQAARQSGFRELITLPASTALPKTLPGSPPNPAPTAPAAKDQPEPHATGPASIQQAAGQVPTPLTFLDGANCGLSNVDNPVQAAISWVPFQDLKTGKTVLVKAADEQPAR
jgi:hypothetical protein